MSIIHEALRKASQVKKNAQEPCVQNSIPEQKKNIQEEILSENTITLSESSHLSSFKNLPKMQKALIFYAGIPIIAIIIAIIMFFASNKPSAGKATSRSQVLSQDAMQLSLIEEPVYIGKEQVLPALSLSGIVHDTEPMAIINDVVYVEGEYVGGARIVEITQSNVIMEKDGKQIKLRVK